MCSQQPRFQVPKGSVNVPGYLRRGRFMPISRKRGLRISPRELSVLIVAPAATFAARN